MADSRDTEDRSEEGSIRGLNELNELGDSIDLLTFEQILEMDDDDGEREFSQSIVFGFFEQAEQTFEKMDVALEEGDLSTLSSLGHFLKGSSATLGLTKVKDSCEMIQNYGAGKDATGNNNEPDESVCLSKIKDTLTTVRADYNEAEVALRAFYAN